MCMIYRLDLLLSVAWALVNITESILLGWHQGNYLGSRLLKTMSLALEYHCQSASCPNGSPVSRLECPTCNKCVHPELAFINLIK